MSPAENRAVFLSYASQDAQVAHRICEALRAAGVEVWFDQSELRGGDAWDQKIRKQIKECALFVPVISANTQARREGYFRIEWKLAAQRTHAIAEGTPFILPIVLDGVQEGQALVPSEFCEVQWTALSAQDAIVPFCVRVKHLTAGSPAGAAPRTSGDANPPETRAQRRMPRLRLFGAFVVVALVIALASIGWRRLHQPTSATANLAKARSRTAELAQRSFIETRDVLDAVVEHARRETEASSESAAAWSKRARLEAQYVVRGWDVSDQRRQEIQTHAKRALALDPASVDAMFALAVVFLQQGAYAEAEALMRTATAREPADAELRQALGTALSGQGRDAEALELRQENLRLFPANPFAHYDLALSFEQASPPDLEAALRKFDDSIALQPLTSTVLHKVSLLAGWRGDLSGAQRLLDTLDPLERTGDRAVGIAMMLGLLQHEPDRVIKAAGMTARTYFDDDYVRGPKAWLVAHAHTQAGKPSLALAQWREAESILRQRLRASAENWFDRAGLAITLAWLGEQTEAASVLAPAEAVARESAKPLQSVYLAYYHAGCGDAAKAASYLRPALERRELITRKTLSGDPWWDKVRAAPPFLALLPPPANANGDNALPAPDAKSIAVLPFANMSSERENEFFTDGIHEDILTNLALIRDVRVVSRTSVMQYRGTTKSIRQIAQELKVAYVLEGSVRRSGNKVRVTGQLIRAGNDEHLWAKAYDRDLTDVFTIQGEIAQAIAGALQSVLSPEAKSILEHRPTENPAAYDLFLKARSLRYNGTFTEQHGIIALLEQAVQLDPKFAAAWGELGSRRAFEFFNMEHTDALLARAKDAIDAAVRLAPDDPLVIEGQGDFYYYGYRDYARATEHYTRLAQLRPNDPAMFWSLGLIQRRQGRFADSRRNFLRAVELDPANRNYAAVTLELLNFGRRYAEGEALARKWVQAWPNDLRLAWSLAVITYSANGATAEMAAFARRTVPPAQRAEHLYHQRLLALMRGDWAEVLRLDGLQRHFDSEDDPNWQQDVTVATVLAELGNLPAARTRMREALAAMQAEESRQSANDVLWANLAVAHALLGDQAESMRCREKALALMPPSRDAIQGAFDATLLASALAWCGEKDRALAEFERLLHVPYGANIHRDRGIGQGFGGAWKPLRDDPRFQALLADPKNNEPLF